MIENNVLLNWQLHLHLLSFCSTAKNQQWKIVSDYLMFSLKVLKKPKQPNVFEFMLINWSRTKIAATLHRKISFKGSLQTLHGPLLFITIIQGILLFWIELLTLKKTLSVRHTHVNLAIYCHLIILMVTVSVTFITTSKILITAFTQRTDTIRYLKY